VIVHVDVNIHTSGHHLEGHLNDPWQVVILGGDNLIPLLLGLLLDAFSVGPEEAYHGMV